MRKAIHRVRDFFRYVQGKSPYDPFVSFIQRAEEEGQEAAFLWLENTEQFFRTKKMRALLQLYRFLQKAHTNLPFSKGAKRTCIIHLPCWGSAYSRKCAEALLPSLLAPGNLPYLAEKTELILLFHTDFVAKEIITQSPSWPYLEKYAKIFWITFPRKLFRKITHFLQQKDFISKFHLLSLVQNQALKLAREEKGYISFQQPDHLHSENFYKVCFEKIQGKSFCVSTCLCTNFAELKEAFTLFSQREGALLEIPPKELNHLAIQHLHHRSLETLVAKENGHFRPSTRLLFKQGESVIVRSKHYHPFLVDCARIAANDKMSFLPIDDDNLSAILDPTLPPELQVAICESHEASLCELTDRAKTFSPFDKEKTCLAKILAEKPVFCSSELHKFFFSHRFQIPASAFPANFEDVDDEEFTSNIPLL